MENGAAVAEMYDSIVKCGVCLDSMLRSGSEPIILHCGHTFCKRCVDELMKDGRGFKCPTCRSHSNTLVKFPINLLLKEYDNFARKHLAVYLAETYQQAAANGKKPLSQELIGQLEKVITENVHYQYEEKHDRLKKEMEDQITRERNAAQYDATLNAQFAFDAELRHLRAENEKKREQMEKNLLEAVSASNVETERILVAKAIAESLSETGFAHCSSSSDSGGNYSRIRQTLTSTSTTNWQQSYGNSVQEQIAADRFEELSRVIYFKEQSALARIKEYDEEIGRRVESIKRDERDRITEALAVKYEAEKNQLKAKFDQEQKKLKLAHAADMRSKSEEMASFRGAWNVERERYEEDLEKLRKSLEEKQELSIALKNHYQDIDNQMDEYQKIVSTLTEEKRQWEKNSAAAEKSAFTIPTQETSNAGPSRSKGRGRGILSVQKQQERGAVGGMVVVHGNDDELDRIRENTAEEKRKLVDQLQISRKETAVAQQLHSAEKDSITKRHLAEKQQLTKEASAEIDRLRKLGNELTEKFHDMRRGMKEEVDRKVKRELQRNNNQCYRCLEYGHRKDHCRYPIAWGQRCYNCLGWNHERETCQNTPCCFKCGGGHRGDQCQLSAFSLPGYF